MTKINIQSKSKLSSRTKFLKRMLDNLQMHDAQRALTLMIEEMSAEKGFKRSSGAHYYHHLVDVTQKLLNHRIRNETVIIVAILHDAIEDTWITYEYIEREFGKEVADAVQILTKDPNIDYKTNPEALKAYLIRCFENIITALVKSADRIHNFGTLGATPLHKQLRVALETEENFFPLFKWAREEYPEYSAFFFQAKTEIEPHLEKIKEFAQMENNYKDKFSEQEASIQALKEELAKSKVDQMSQIVDGSEVRRDYIKTIHVLDQHNKEMKSVLEYYADEKQYDSKEILNDYGRKASKVLNHPFE